MINVKTNWRNFVGILIICLLIRKINTYIFGRKTQYTFTVWQCIIWMWICKYCCFCHIICFGINMTPMWHDCIFICLIYVIWFFVRPFVLSIIYLIFDFFITNHAMIVMMHIYFWKIYNIHNHTWPCIFLTFLFEVGIVNAM